MKTLQIKSLARQRGFNILQAVLLVALSALGSVYIFNTYTDTSEAAKSNFAFEEVSNWLGAMTSIAATQGHVFTGMDQDDVLDRTSIPDAVNTYGLNITVAVATNNWQLTYPFEEASQCQYVLDRIIDHPGLSTTAPSCSADDELVAVIE